MLGAITIATPLIAHTVHHDVCKQTTLYSLTFPPQKEPDMILCHPTGKALVAANNANIEFNKGGEAGHMRTLTFNSTNQLNCPSGNSKEFCSGWKSATQFTLEQLTARGSHHDNNTTGIKGFPSPRTHYDWNTAIPSYYKQVSVFCQPTASPTQMFSWNWCIW
jgi:hypothetical protein